MVYNNNRAHKFSAFFNTFCGAGKTKLWGFTCVAHLYATNKWQLKLLGKIVYYYPGERIGCIKLVQFVA